MCKLKLLWWSQSIADNIKQNQKSKYNYNLFVLKLCRPLCNHITASVHTVHLQCWTTSCSGQTHTDKENTVQGSSFVPFLPAYNCIVPTGIKCNISEFLQLWLIKKNKLINGPSSESTSVWQILIRSHFSIRAKVITESAQVILLEIPSYMFLLYEITASTTWILLVT